MTPDSRCLHCDRLLIGHDADWLLCTECTCRPPEPWWAPVARLPGYVAAGLLLGWYVVAALWRLMWRRR